MGILFASGISYSPTAPDSRVYGAIPSSLEADTCLRRLNLEAAITFTLRGRTFEKRKDDFVKAVKGLKSSRIRKYSVLIGDKRYPIRQVLAAATKLRVTVVTSQDALRVLEKFGFTVDAEG
jgi:hypothetical protein